jgi:hypothetical protein
VNVGNYKEEETMFILRRFVNCTFTLIWLMKSRSKLWAGHVERMRNQRNEYVVLVENPEGNGSPLRLGRRW